MDAAVEEIIANIIHIDKSAVVLKENVENQISERKLHVEDEIKKLRCEIIDKQKDSIAALKEVELSKAKNESDEILEAANRKNKEIQEMFFQKKDDFVKTLFYEIISK